MQLTNERHRRPMWADECDPDIETTDWLECGSFYGTNRLSEGMSFRVEPTNLDRLFIDSSAAIRILSAAFDAASGLRQEQALIDGKTVTFSSIEDKFDALVAEWKRTRTRGSSTAPLVDDAYGQIVAMGRDAIPLLLHEVRKQSGHWITALVWITGVNLATAETRGDVRKLREAWLRWGDENGYSEGRVVRGTTARHQRI